MKSGKGKAVVKLRLKETCLESISVFPTLLDPQQLFPLGLCMTWGSIVRMKRFNTCRHRCVEETLTDILSRIKILYVGFPGHPKEIKENAAFVSAFPW